MMCVACISMYGRLCRTTGLVAYIYVLLNFTLQDPQHMCQSAFLSAFQDQQAACPQKLLHYVAPNVASPLTTLDWL